MNLFLVIILGLVVSFGIVIALGMLAVYVIAGAFFDGVGK